MSTPTAVAAIAAGIGIGGCAVAWAITRLGLARGKFAALCDLGEDPDACDDHDLIYGGTTWDARWDVDEPRPGTGPRRNREVL
ncbi:hypothetical protein BJF79_39695 [Actinomadura sp. CNU-125]|uniref:hypothetical protein n=1 Tax=Actinomadura sp. CNU-125 TaxID=1904961 RepID=UPI00095D0929|nr:hypothetical protein [Actinomadura sp. CNU-125]OLT30076.1 hypothetical protein BJF79_39695 [Actinomadura sp. CNU-125]